MKKISYLFAILSVSTITFSSCSKDSDDTMTTPTADFSGTYNQKDQMGRPAINTVFVGADKKDIFNTTIPSMLGPNYKASFEAGLKALSPVYAKAGGKNALGLDAPTFASVLAADALGVSMSKPTTYFDGTNVLTGRNLKDDVISVSLLLIFGGATGTENPGLTDDNVSANDKQFQAAFPYLATPW